MTNKALILGGDIRMRELYNLLTQQMRTDLCGFDRLEYTDTVTVENALKNIHNYKYLILPIPYKEDEWIKMPFSDHKLPAAGILKKLQYGQKVFLGSLNDVEPTEATVCNLLKRKDYAQHNAYLTSLVISALLTVKYGVDVSGKKILICGYGKIARCLSIRLQNLGAVVSVAARKQKDLTEISSRLSGSVDIYDLEKHISEFDIIINTVPSLIISRRELKMVRENAVMIDLASVPYGIDFEEAEKQGKHAYLELGLPGKYTPKLEAQYLFEEIQAFISEE